MTPTCVSVPELFTRRGGVLLRYATDLAARLGVPLRRESLRSPETPDRLWYDDGSILVADACARRDVTLLAPFEEVSVLSRGHREAMIPLGNGGSGLHAAAAGLPVIAALGLPVVFYHTTWRDPAVVSDDPVAHACTDARTNIRRAEDMAGGLGIAARTVIETAEGVVDGALLRALTDRCCLLVVARGRDTGKGSYVDQWLAKSPVPVMVMGRKEVSR